MTMEEVRRMTYRDIQALMGVMQEERANRDLAQQRSKLRRR
jgi:hypothetical protein